MRFDVITLFPELFASFLGASLLGKAIGAGVLRVYLTNPRDFTTDRHRTVDDTPYGGGVGMVCKAEPLCAAACLRVSFRWDWKTSTERATKVASAPIASDTGLNGRSTEPNGVDFVFLLNSEVGEY